MRRVACFPTCVSPSGLSIHYSSPGPRHTSNSVYPTSMAFSAPAPVMPSPLPLYSTKLLLPTNPVDPSIESLHNDEKDQFDIDLLYCGIDYKDPLRSQLLNGLNDNLQEVRFSLYGSLGNPPVFGADYLDVLAKSKMGLNLSRRDNIPYYSSDRIAQLSGNGLLVFIPETPGFHDLYTDEEVVYFQGGEDLHEKVLHYQRNDSERQQIARRGREKAHSSFNTTRVTQFITEATFGLDQSEEYEWADV